MCVGGEEGEMRDGKKAGIIENNEDERFTDYACASEMGNFSFSGDDGGAELAYCGLTGPHHSAISGRVFRTMPQKSVTPRGVGQPKLGTEPVGSHKSGTAAGVEPGAGRFLVIIADDYGIGPETSRGILELASGKLVTGTVLLVNSPYAEEAVRAWRSCGSMLEMGWHPCLTLDAPVAPPARVSSLLGTDGRLLPLPRFLARLYARQICPRQIETELHAQYDRFLELIGQPPSLVNTHHHVGVFPPVGAILHRVLMARGAPLPYLRRVREPWSMLARIAGARKKRTLLTLLGRIEARRQMHQGFPGNDWLAGITDPKWVKDAGFFARWLGRVPGRIVELACHPGHPDATLIGRDCTEYDGLAQRRVDELHLLQQANFLEACRQAGFTPVSPSELLARETGRLAHAA
jgi:predicted glycoside hydrolase/deacetylase ChbG (UPF0249 family)